MKSRLRSWNVRTSGAMKRWLSWVRFSQPQEILVSKSHTFRTKVFKHPCTCAVCKESIWNEGRTCKNCKYVCHTKCEYMVATTCSPAVNYQLPSCGDLSNYSSIKFKQRTTPQRNSMSVQTDTIPPVTPPRGNESYIMDSLDLDVDYVTERIISMSFPGGGLESQYQANLKDVVQMLQRKHGDNYLFFNLSRRRHDINKLNMQVVDIGWPDQLAPPLEKLCSVCKQIETWLKADTAHVVVIHCKGGRGPIGVVVSAYVGYLNFSNSTDTALDRYAMMRFLDAKTGSAMHPSQRRYIDYFSGLLTRSIQINNSPLFLHYVFIHGVPNFDTAGGCRPFVRIYQNMQTVFTSGVYTVTEGTTRFAVPFDQALPLKGDILVKCYHKKFRSTTRDVIFRVQFHTTAVMEYRLVFQKSDLDDACTDPRFPAYTKVEFIFSATPDKIHNSDYVRGSSFPVENSNDPLIRWDSYEHFDSLVEGGEDADDAGLGTTDIINVPHLSAPDGSLYAQVLKHNSVKTEQVNNSASTPLLNGPVQINGPLQQNGVTPKTTNAHPGVASVSNGPVDRSKYGPSFKEKRELDELLQGFDDLLAGIEEKESADVGNFVSVQRQISQSSKSDAAKSIHRAVPHISPTSPSRDSGYSRSSTEIENPYAEIHDKEKRGVAQNGGTTGKVTNPLYAQTGMRNNSNHHTNNTYGTESLPDGQGLLNGRPLTNGQILPNDQILAYGQNTSNGPLQEETVEAQAKPVEFAANPQIGVHNPLRYSANDRLAELGHASEDRTRLLRSSSPLPLANHDSIGLQYTHSFGTPENQLSSIGSPVQTQGRNYYNPNQSPTSPIRAQKEIIKVVHTSPGSPSYLGSPLIDRRHQESPVSPTPSETSSEGSTDSLTWLQKQQLKLKQKRDRERRSQGAAHPLYIDTMMGNRLGYQTPPQATISPVRSNSHSRVNELNARFTPPQVSPGSITSTSMVSDQRLSPPAYSESPRIGQLKDTFNQRATKQEASLQNSPRNSAPTIQTQVTRQQPLQHHYPQYIPPPEAHHSPPQSGTLSRKLSDSTFDRNRMPMHQKPIFENHVTTPHAVDANVVSRPPRSPRKERIYSNPVNEKRMQQMEKPQHDAADARAIEPVDEPVIKQGTVASRVADARAKIDELERSMSPPALERQPRSLHRNNSAIGYDNGIRSRTPSPEVWISNPGGRPQQETYYWNRLEGLRSPELEAQRQKERLIEYGPMNDTLPNTPSFPLEPKTPYCNMVSTPLAYVARPSIDKEIKPQLASSSKDSQDKFEYPQSMQERSQEMSPSKMNGPITTEVNVSMAMEKSNQMPLAHSTPISHRQQHSPEPKMVHFEIDDFSRTHQSQNVSPKILTNGHSERKEVSKEPLLSPNHEKIEKNHVRFAEKDVPKPDQDENRNECNMRDLTLQPFEQTIIPTNQQKVHVQVHHTPPSREQAPSQVLEVSRSLPLESQNISPQYTKYNGQLTTVPNEQTVPSGAQDVAQISPTGPFASVEIAPKNYYPTFSDRLKSKPPSKSGSHQKLPESDQANNLEGELDMSGYRTVYDNRGKHHKPSSPALVRSGSANGSGRTTPSNFYLNEQPSLSSSQTSLAEPGVENVRFVKDLSSWWYKPHISRDDAISMLKDKQPGTFVVRDSNSFPGAFGLAVKVTTPPPNAPQLKKPGDAVSELVRHFLIEPNSRGVKLKGCQNEPIFCSLSALVYQHTLKQLALPCKLILPETDPASTSPSANESNSRANLLAKGAACNVLYLHSFDMESLTGSSAVCEAASRLKDLATKPPSVIVHFKVSSKGITVTDNNRKLFFRRHYPVESVLFCGLDSNNRRWHREQASEEADARIFGFVSRKPGSLTDNVCHLFAEYENEQPASAIVSFVTKVLIGQSVSLKTP